MHLNHSFCTANSNRRPLFAIILQFKLFYHYFPDILKGSVGILNNYNLCHIKTIKWEEIITGPRSKYVYVYNFTEPERDCTPCHESCKDG